MRDDNLPPQEISLAEPVSIVLTLAQWNLILQMVVKAPWDTADPLIRTMQNQIRQALMRAPPQPAEPA
jgi:hypothetical protein